MSDDERTHYYGDGCEDAHGRFVCPACKSRSYHPYDIQYGYCGNCHDWTGEELSKTVARTVARIVAGTKAFAEEMRAEDIHVGMGTPARCVTCGEPWPCGGNRDA